MSITIFVTLGPSTDSRRFASTLSSVVSRSFRLYLSLTWTTVGNTGVKVNTNFGTHDDPQSQYSVIYGNIIIYNHTILQRLKHDFSGLIMVPNQEKAKEEKRMKVDSCLVVNVTRIRMFRIQTKGFGQQDKNLNIMNSLL